MFQFDMLAVIKSLIIVTVSVRIWKIKWANTLNFEPTQKHIHEKDLSDDIDEIEEFAKEETEGVNIIVVNVRDEIFQNELLPCALVVVLNDGAVQIHHEHLHTSTFPTFPQVSWNVEEHGLEEKNKAHPLIVFVVFHLIGFACQSRYTGMRHINSCGGSQQKEKDNKPIYNYRFKSILITWLAKWQICFKMHNKIYVLIILLKDMKLRTDADSLKCNIYYGILVMRLEIQLKL